MDNEIFTKEIRHDFTDSEKLSFSRQLAACTRELKTVQDEKKAVNSEFKKRIEDIDARIEAYTRKIIEGYEIRLESPQSIQNAQGDNIVNYQLKEAAVRPKDA
jgi:hypothetical protein